MTADIQLNRHLQLFCWGKSGRKDRLTRSTADVSSITEAKTSIYTSEN
jgi:hypothetical protein